MRSAKTYQLIFYKNYVHIYDLYKRKLFTKMSKNVDFNH